MAKATMLRATAATGIAPRTIYVFRFSAEAVDPEVCKSKAIGCFGNVFRTFHVQDMAYLSRIFACIHSNQPD